MSKGKTEASDGPRPAGRPRSDAARAAVLGAAYELLLETGLGGFSIEAIARRAGVARTTIYRWWPSKSVLAVESFLEAFRPQLAQASTGAPEGDFHAFVASLAAALGGPAGRVAASVVAQAQDDPQTRQIFREEFSEPLRADTARLLRAGVEAGRFRAELDIPRVIDAAVGAVYFRLLLGHPLDRAWARGLADTLLNGCLAATPPAGRRRV